MSFEICLLLDADGDVVARGPAEEMLKKLRLCESHRVVRESDGAELAKALPCRIIDAIFRPGRGRRKRTSTRQSEPIRPMDLALSIDEVFA